MTRPRNPRMQINGKEYRRCPICGGPMTTFAYNTYKICNTCNKLKNKNMSEDEIKSIRKPQLMNELRDKDIILDDGKTVVDINEDITKDNLKLQNDKAKALEIDFLKTYPPGITVRCTGKDESLVVKEAYNQFARGIENISQFNALVNQILFATLQSYRINQEITYGVEHIETKRVDGKEEEVKTLRPLSSSQLKDSIDLQIKLGKSISDTSKTIEDMKMNAMADGGNILMKEFSNMLKYHHDNGQEYNGVGVCSDCGQRIIFTTNFITFKNYYEKKVLEIYDKLRHTTGMHLPSLDLFKDTIIGEITDDSVRETYTIKHIRKLEEALI